MTDKEMKLQDGGDSHLTDHDRWRLDRNAALPCPSLPPKRRNIFFKSEASHPQANALEESLEANTCPALSKRYVGGENLATTIGDMEKIASYICETPWVEPTGVIPAGYTYLAQLVAHDICKPTLGKFAYERERPVMSATMRSSRPIVAPHNAMMLQSIFGPMENQGDQPEITSPEAPRSRRRQTRPLSRLPAFDLKRSKRSGQFIRGYADPRNQDTPMISQLCALFVRLKEIGTAKLKSEGHDDYRAAILAHEITVGVYLDIIEKDLLKRLLLPSVYRHYVNSKDDSILLDRRLSGASSDIPIEFTNGVFRFGHAMVRRQYDLNWKIIGQPIESLIGSANRDDWWVDWSKFFEIGNEKSSPQAAREIGPNYVDRFAEAKEMQIESKHGDWTNDLALIDLTRSVDAGLLKVAEVISEIRTPFADVEGSADWYIWDDNGVANLMSGWAQRQKDKGKRFPEHAKSDPPFAAFVLIEAGESNVNHGFGAGKSLGCVASIVVAEVVFSAILNSRYFLAYEEARVGSNLMAAKHSVLGNSQLECIPSLLKFLSKNSNKWRDK